MLVGFNKGNHRTLSSLFIHFSLLHTLSFYTSLHTRTCTLLSLVNTVTLGLLTPASLLRLVSLLCEYDKALFGIFWAWGEDEFGVQFS